MGWKGSRSGLKLDGRDPTKIYALDSVAALQPKPTPPAERTATEPRKAKKQPYPKRLRAARERLVAYPVLREIPRRGQLRKKVVVSGNVFFSLYALECESTPAILRSTFPLKLTGAPIRQPSSARQRSPSSTGKVSTTRAHATTASSRPSTTSSSKQSQ